MVEIHVHRDADGYRTYIRHGRRTSVIDGAFKGGNSDLRTGECATTYLYGT